MAENRSLLSSFLSDLLRQILSNIQSAAEKKMKRYLTALVLETAALVIILFGIGSLLGSYFPDWRPGLSHILTGAAVLIFLAAYEKR